ncbi:MAG: hypothetical protein OXL68_16565 [Paracoccaceae bacterium]|nr:hypothetical protein [Paracoccaceae bacterium]
MIAVVEDGGYVHDILDRLRELEARRDEPNGRLSAAPTFRTSTPTSRPSTGAR